MSSSRKNIRSRPHHPGSSTMLRLVLRSPLGLTQLSGKIQAGRLGSDEVELRESVIFRQVDSDGPGKVPQGQ